MSRLSMADRLYATLAYAAVFSYPLTLNEIYRYFIGQAVTKREVLTLLTQHFGVDVSPSSVYTIQGGNRFGMLRLQRMQCSHKKLTYAEQVARWYALIPTVRLVGVTGGVSMGNAEHEDDIDLCIISAPGTIFMTRLMVTLLTEIVGRRRRYQAVFIQDAICLNMFLDEVNASVPQDEQDLYSAHEVVQLIPLWDRGGVYRAFLEANAWVSSFLPVAYRQCQDRLVISYSIPKWVSLHVINVFRMVEPFVRFLQLQYMARHRTSEVISSTVLRFHPRDMRRVVKTQLRQLLKKQNIPLDNLFSTPLK